MKEKYREPLMDVVLFLSETSDIICASQDVELDYGNGGDGWTDDDLD